MADETTSEILLDKLVPLPYRAVFLIQLGHFLWLAVVYGCSRLGLNVLQLINLSYAPHKYPQLGAYSEFTEVGEHATVEPADQAENERLLKGIWANFKGISFKIVLSFALFKAIQLAYDFKDPQGNTWVIKLLFKMVPSATFGFLVYKLFDASDKSVGKLRLSTTVKRIVRGGINSLQMRTNDILLSDSLMSYSKVLNDIALYVWTVSLNSPYNVWVEFFVLCVPSCIRMIQCYREYRLTNNKTHLLNLLKYFSGVFPIFVNLLIKINIMKYKQAPDEEKQFSVSILSQLNIWWYLTSFVSSLYSFVWDVKMDWGFELFDFIFHNAKFKPLRQDEKLVHGNTLIYYLVIYIDLCLRFVWVMKVFIIEEAENVLFINKVGLFLFGYDAFSFGYCLVETLEIFRRFVWCFFKLESDWVKLNHQAIELNKIG